jgi:hypothetical protein
MRWILAVSRHNFLPDGGRIFHEVLRQTGARPAGILIHDNGSLAVAAKALAAWTAGARHCGGALLKSVLLNRPSVWESESGIPHLHAADLNAPDAVEFVKVVKADLGIHVRTRSILGAALLKAPRLGWVNVHHGLLPNDRGTSCDLDELRHGRPAGFSLHRMTESVDAGEILETVVVEDRICHDYARYLEASSRLEAHAVHRLVESVTREGCLPVGRENRSTQLRWSRTPGWKQLRHLVRQEGFQL